MARAVFGGRDPVEAKTAEAMWSRMNTRLRKIALGYDYKQVTGCHLSNDLLARYSRNADLRVAVALQRYCSVMPEAEYPCAIRSWPWDAEHMDRWVLAHKEKEASAGKGRARALPDMKGMARALPDMPRATPSGEPSGKIRREPRASVGAAAASSASGASASSGSAAPAAPPAAAPASTAAAAVSSASGACASPGSAAPVAPPAAAPGSLYSKWAEAP